MRYVSQAYRAKKALKCVFDAETRKKHVDVELTDDDTLIVYDKNGEVTRRYDPHRTLKVYHKDDADLKIIRGAFGSGKSTGNMVLELIKQAIKMPKCKDCIRRSRTCVFRNTMKELKETSIDLWITWFEELGIVRSHESIPLQYIHDFRDKDGLIHLEVWFLAIDKPKQLRDMKSLQMTNALLGELSELSQLVLQYSLARVGRYPAKMLLRKEDRDYNCFVWADTNADLDTHWMYEIWQKDTVEVTGHGSNDYRIFKKEIKYDIFGEKKVIKISIYEQPPAFLEDGKLVSGRINWVANPLAENIEFLEGGFAYYFRQLVNGDDFVKVYACGRPGIVRSGKPVYPAFNPNLHAVESIDVNKNFPLLIGLDYGYDCPAFVICQYYMGRVFAIKEFWSRKIYIEELYMTEVEPWLKDNAEDLEYKAFDDPANTFHGRQRLSECGFMSKAASSNKLSDRHPFVELMLTQMPGGKPAIQISKTGCPVLYAGFVGKYVFEMVSVVGSETPKLTPTKEHPVSDVHNGFEYAVQSVKLKGLSNKKKDFSGFLNRERY